MTIVPPPCSTHPHLFRWSQEDPTQLPNGSFHAQYSAYPQTRPHPFGAVLRTTWKSAQPFENYRLVFPIGHTLAVCNTYVVCAQGSTRPREETKALRLPEEITLTADPNEGHWVWQRLLLRPPTFPMGWVLDLLEHVHLTWQRGREGERERQGGREGGGGMEGG